MGLRVALPVSILAAALGLGGFVLLHQRSHRQPAAPPYPNPALVSSIWSVSVAGGAPKLLLRDRGWQDSDPLVLPDGTIAFERPTSVSTTGLFGLRAAERHPRWLRKLPVLAALGYSTGRGEIATQRGHAIVAQSIRGRTLRVLAHVRGSSWSIPVWSHDGSTLAYAQTVRTVANPYQAELVILRHGETHTLPFTGSPRALALSPHGDRLVFSWGSGLYVLDTASGKKRLLASRASPYAAWSPDGRFITYDGASGLVLLDVASDRRRVISRRGATAAFTPDGRDLVFITLATR